MLKSVREYFLKALDYLVPPRTNFEIVNKLKDEDIQNLPQAEKSNGVSWIHPLFDYHDKKVRAIIWELKYKNNTKPLDTIGKIIFDEILSQTSEITIFDSDASFVLIPIPITNQRRSERGYNQSEYISRSIIENDSNHILLYAPQWLSKTKETPSQSHTETREERTKNLSGCFEANPQVENKYLILIDDVVTTGSTLSEARKELLSKGAKDVFAFTIAH
jgi:competence protein ComFC